MTRNGKVARLPATVREALNQRMLDGEQGEALLTWLNEQPEVVAMVASQFKGAPINKQSLSEWRLGGYQEWERNQRALAWAERVEGRAKSVQGEEALSDRVSTVMVIELGMAVDELMATVSDPQERWDRLLPLVVKLTGVRRMDHRREKLKMEREKWKHDAAARERAEKARLEEEEYQRLIEPVTYEKSQYGAMVMWSPSEAGRKVADYMVAARYRKPLPFTREELACYATIARCENLVHERAQKAKEATRLEDMVRNMANLKRREAKERTPITDEMIGDFLRSLGANESAVQAGVERAARVREEQQRRAADERSGGAVENGSGAGNVGKREDEKAGGAANAEGALGKAEPGKAAAASQSGSEWVRLEKQNAVEQPRREGAKEEGNAEGTERTQGTQEGLCENQAAGEKASGEQGKREDEKAGGLENAEGGLRIADSGKVTAGNGAADGKKPDLAAIFTAYDELLGRSIEELQAKLFGVGGAAAIGGG